MPFYYKHKSMCYFVNLSSLFYFLSMNIGFFFSYPRTLVQILQNNFTKVLLQSDYKSKKTDFILRSHVTIHKSFSDCYTKSSTQSSSFWHYFYVGWYTNTNKYIKLTLNFRRIIQINYYIYYVKSIKIYNNNSNQHLIEKKNVILKY